MQHWGMNSSPITLSVPPTVCVRRSAHTAHTQCVFCVVTITTHFSHPYRRPAASFTEYHKLLPLHRAKRERRRIMTRFSLEDDAMADVDVIAQAFRHACVSSRFSSVLCLSPCRSHCYLLLKLPPASKLKI